MIWEGGQDCSGQNLGLVVGVLGLEGVGQLGDHQVTFRLPQQHQRQQVGVPGVDQNQHTMATAMGFASGTTTLQNCRQVPAPSMRAASNKGSGCRPHMPG